MWILICIGTVIIILTTFTTIACMNSSRISRMQEQYSKMNKL